MRARVAAAAAAGVALLALSALAGLLVGVRDASAAETLRALPDALRWAASPAVRDAGDAGELAVVIGSQRVPRTVLALVAGMALGAAGALIQGHTRNPLADPGLLGVNAGAAAAVTVAVFAGVARDPAGFVWPALAGALAATALILLLADAGPVAGDPLGLVLAGVAVGAVLMAVGNALLLHGEAALDAMRSWSTGSVAGRDLSAVGVAGPVAAAGAALALALGPGLNLLALGEDVAHGLGAPIRRHRLLTLLAVSLLGAAAVACAGPVAFIGLAAPHMVRAVAGHDYRVIVPASLLAGGALAVWADILGRLIARPAEVPMGVVLAIVGAPLFIGLIRSGRVRGAL